MFTRLFLSLSKYRPKCTGNFNNCHSTLTVNRSKRTRRGTKAGRNILRSIRTITSSYRDNSNDHSTGINHDNLIPLTTEAPSNIPTVVRQRSDKTLYSSSVNVSNLVYPEKSHNWNGANQLLLTLLNARSVKNKTLSINDYLISNDIDILALTETWLGSIADKCVISELVPNGYGIHHISRTERKGGGVAIIHKSNLEIKPIKRKKQLTQFELLECSINSNLFRLFVVYRPPPSRNNKLKTTTFFEEWLEFLDYTTEFSGEIIIVGDLNFHLDDVSDCGGRRFTESLSDRGLVQQVDGLTHIRGHTLDVIISRENSSILLGEPSIEDTQIYNDKSNASLDHFAVHSRINLRKPARLKKSLTIRKINNIDVESFKADIDTNCFIHNNDPGIENLVKSHNSDLKAVLDKHAPVQTKIITMRPNTEWYGDKIRKAKVKRRKAERTMRKTKLEVHKLIYKELCVTSNKILIQSKTDYFSNKISDIGNDHKKLFKLTNGLLGNSNDVILPSHQSEFELLNRFGHFFLEKIENIRTSLLSANNSIDDIDPLRAKIYVLKATLSPTSTLRQLMKCRK
ncbi:unnamed protein product [Mytilus edulis]|uniref:Endonuclease/exonuclease/phosphatase domain-containing protein n=1 Tax=Mytilus edulis TaxID=6550 RepID=A0A8S3VB85_MYTED|nr:unnamed protein product [Mytilus edulis]